MLCYTCIVLPDSCSPPGDCSEETDLTVRIFRRRSYYFFTIHAYTAQARVHFVIRVHLFSREKSYAMLRHRRLLAADRPIRFRHNIASITARSQRMYGVHYFFMARTRVLMCVHTFLMWRKKLTGQMINASGTYFGMKPVLFDFTYSRVGIVRKIGDSMCSNRFWNVVKTKLWVYFLDVYDATLTTCSMGIMIFIQHHVSPTHL